MRSVVPSAKNLPSIPQPRLVTNNRWSNLPREQERLHALDDLQLLDTSTEEDYDEVTRLASELCGTPMSLVSLVDAERQWFKASVGLSVKETHRDVSFCSHAIQQEDVFVVENAETDGRFADNTLVTGAPGIRFYAGVPLLTEDNHAVGTLCVLDTKPRELTASQKQALQILAKQVQTRLHLRARLRQLEESLEENRRLTARLEISRDTFRAFMNKGPFASFVKDKSGRLTFYNRRMAETFGVDQEAWIGKTDEELWPAELAEDFRRVDHQVLTQRESVEAIETVPTANGDLSYWKVYKFPLRHESGEMMLGGMSLDVTADFKREAELTDALAAKDAAFRELEANRRMLCEFDAQTPTLSYVKSDGRYVSYNKAFADFFGIGPMDWLGRLDYDLHSKEVVDASRAHENLAEQAGTRVESCHTVLRPDGMEAVLRIVRFPIAGRAGERLIGGIAVDITEDVRAQQRLEDSNQRLQNLADIDSLTFLSTRRVFDEKLCTAFDEAQRNGTPLSIVILDVDNFKRRNDQFGHAAGDEALRLLGRVLMTTKRQDDLAARIGGEEFALLLPRTSAEDAVSIAERVRLALREAACTSGQMTASLGVDSLDQTTGTCERLCSRADDAMYQAKRTGKDRVVLYRDHANGLLAQAAIDQHNASERNVA